MYPHGAGPAPLAMAGCWGLQGHPLAVMGQPPAWSPRGSPELNWLPQRWAGERGLVGSLLPSSSTHMLRPRGRGQGRAGGHQAPVRRGGGDSQGEAPSLVCLNPQAPSRWERRGRARDVPSASLWLMLWPQAMLRVPVA